MQLVLNSKRHVQAVESAKAQRSRHGATGRNFNGFWGIVPGGPLGYPLYHMLEQKVILIGLFFQAEVTQGALG